MIPKIYKQYSSDQDWGYHKELFHRDIFRLDNFALFDAFLRNSGVF